MGTTARVFIAHGPTGVESRVLERLHELEARWSRFVDSSEVSTINANPGQAVPVSGDTLLLCERAISASRRTGGWFDPTLLNDLIAAGYDRPFEELAATGIPDLVITIDRSSDGDRVQIHDWTAASRAIEVDNVAGTVAVPVGIALDPGGIGKGLAADLLAAEALEAGAGAVLIDLGGDIVAGGRPPRDGWAIAVEDPFDRTELAETIRLPWGAVATSSRSKRRWLNGTDESHHLIDPTTRCPSDSDVAACTVIAGACWLAESFAKAAVLAGSSTGLELLTAAGLEGVLFDVHGCRHYTPGMAGFVT